MLLDCSDCLAPRCKSPSTGRRVAAAVCPSGQYYRTILHTSGPAGIIPLVADFYHSKTTHIPSRSQGPVPQSALRL